MVEREKFLDRKNIPNSVTGTLLKERIGDQSR